MVAIRISGLVCKKPHDSKSVLFSRNHPEDLRQRKQEVRLGDRAGLDDPVGGRRVTVEPVEAQFDRTQCRDRGLALQDLAQTVLERISFV